MVALWQQGEDSAYEAIYKRYFIRLLNIAWQKTGDRTLAEELAQDTLVAAYQQKGKLKEDDLDGYLFIVLRNKVYNHYRHELVRLKYKEKLLATAAIFQEDEPVERKLFTELLHKQINNLPTQCREAFLLSRRDQLSYKEIAEQMAISVNTVEKHIGKALKILRSELSDHELLILLSFFSSATYFC